MVGFTIPLSIFGTQASKTFMQLEEQAIRFKRVYGELFTPPEEADQMLETLKELGKEFTKYGVAVEKTLGLAADAAAMGKTGTELLDQVTEANRLAVLGNVEQQQALETTISITNAFGVATEELAKKIDFLNAVENQTVVSIEDMTIAVPKAGPVVQQLGGDVEDLAFFLTAMKEGGINASEGANALKSGLASLINPTDQAANMLKVFGINVKEIVANSRGDVKKLVVDFASALDTLNPAQRAQAIEQLFGKFQFSRLSTLFQNVIQEGTQASRVLELANATTQELAQLSEKELKRVEESTTFKFRKAIEEFQLAIAPVGEEFLKLITPIIEFATKIIEKFNSLSDNAKGFITGLTVLLGAVGPVAIMTFGLLANGVANIIKGFTFVRELFMKTGNQSTILGNQLDYMTVEQLQAAAVAASLDQVHQKLIQTFSSETTALQNLANVYKQAFNEQQRFDTGRNIARAAGLRLNSGIVSVPGPKGAGDIVPAMLSPGEAVIPADAAKKYAPIIQGMIAGNIPGFAKGAFLGMPRSGKGTQKDREAAEQVYAMFQNSSYANVAPRNYGHQLAKTTGHSFPIFGLGGVYMSPEGNKVFVKPVLDERAAIAEIRATQIARQAHGLKAPEQKIVVMQDPTDPKRQRRFLALESALDSTFVNNDPMAVFNEDQYFKQLVASLLRADKDLSASNVYKDVVADVGPAGVFSRASGLRDYADNLPSMEQQAMINLLGIKGGAKRAFAESTVALMAGLTPKQYQQKMVSEIQQVLPLLKQTVAGFNLTDPREVKVYSDMIARLEQGLTVDWSKFHAIHSAVKPSKPKQSIAGYADGVVSVPGPKGKGDVTPAMLTPGEAVIPADKAKKYAGLIQAMIYGDIPGYENSNVKRQSAIDPQIAIASLQKNYQKEIQAFPQFSEAISRLVSDMQGSVTSVKELKEKVKQELDGLKSLIKTTGEFNKERGPSGQSAWGVNATHGNARMVLTAEDARMIGDEMVRRGLTGGTAQALQSARSSVDAFSNLVFPMPRAFNTGNMSGQAGADWINQDKNRFMSLISSNTGLDPNDPGAQAFADGVANALAQAGATAISESMFEEIIAQQIEVLAEGAAKQALMEARDTYTTFNVVSPNSKSGNPHRQPSQVGIGVSPSREVIETSQRSFRGGALRNVTAQFDQEADLFVVSIVEELVQAIKDGLRIASPSKEFEEVTVAVAQGVEQGKDEATAAGAKVADAIADGATGASGAVRVGRRRVTTDPAAIAAFQQSQAEKMKPRGPRRATRLADKDVRESQQAQERQTQSTQMLSRATDDSSDKLMRMNSLLMNGTFALSSLTGVLSLFGGQFAELNQQIFGITTAIFALMQVVQLLTQAKIAEIAATRFKIASDAAFGPAIGPKTAAQAATGLVASLGRIGTFVTKFLGPVGLVVAGLTALGGALGFIIAKNEEQARKIEGMGDAAFIAGEKLKKIGELYGFAPKQGSMGTAFSGEGTTSIEAEKKSAELSTSEQFATDYAAEIDGVRFATEAQATAILQSLAESLYTSGASQPVVEAIIKTIRDKSEKTGLDISFASINVEENPEKLGAGLDKAVSGFVSAFEQRVEEKDVSINVGATTTLRELEFDVGTSFSDTLGDDAAIAAGSFAAALTGINTQLVTGTIEYDQFKVKLAEIEAQWNSLGDAGQSIVLPDLAEQLNAQGTLEGITSNTDAFLLLKAAASGLPADEIAEYSSILKEVQKDAVTGKITEDSKKLNAAATARTKLNAKIKETASNLRKVVLQGEQEAIINENIGTAAAQLNDRVVALQNQSAAYQILIDQGYSAEVAFDLAGDAGLAAGIKAAFGAGIASDEWKNLKALLDQVLAAEKKAPKSPSGAGQKSPIQQATEALKEQREEIVNSNIAYKKLIQANFDVASAAKAAEDPILAAALATTKVGTEAWNKLVKRIREVQALLSKKEIQDLLRGGKIEIADKKAQIAVSGALTTLGWTAEQIDEVLSDQEFTNTLAKDLQDGSINSKDLLNRLSQIKQLGDLEVQLNFTTKEGAAEEFQKKYDKVVGYLEAQKQTIEVDFQVKTASDSITARKAEEAIAAIQFKIDDFEAELTGIEDQESKINEQYDERKKALDEISKANDRIQRQQKSQLTLADALSQGDIAAAARAAQEVRAQRTQESLQKQGEFLDKSREMSLEKIRSTNGRSRKQIEAEIKKLKDEIFVIEEKTLEPANERIRLAGVEKNAKLDSINAQILRWDVLAARVNEAKLKLTPEEMTAMEYQAGLIADLLENWDKIEDKTAILTIVKKTLGEEETTVVTPEDDGKKDGSGDTSSGPTSPKAVVTPMAVATAAKILNAKTALNNAAPGADSAKASATLAKAAGVVIGKTTADTAERKIVNAVASASKAVAGRTADSIERAVNAAKPAAPVINPRLMKASGGMIKRYASGGFAMGTDIVPAMLTPGEFVVRKHAVQNFGVDRLRAINSGQYGSDSVYNYEVNVNVKSDANPDQIARAVMTQIRQIDSQRIRSTKL
jgi:TP901 family phage tail tape measure protein